MVAGFAQQHPDAGRFVRLLVVAVERLQVEAEFAEMFRLEFAHLELKRHQAVEAPVEEQQIEEEIPVANLHLKLLADKAEITPEFEQEVFEMPDQPPLQVSFAVGFRKVEEFDQVTVFEDRSCRWGGYLATAVRVLAEP